MEIGRGPIAGFGGTHAERSSGPRVASWYRRSLRVLYGFGIWHLGSRYGCPGKPFGWRRNLCCGSLRRNLLDPALESSENFRVATLGAGREPECNRLP
jgi:hypothetical protein